MLVVSHPSRLLLLLVAVFLSSCVPVVFSALYADTRAYETASLGYGRHVRPIPPSSNDPPLWAAHILTFVGSTDHDPTLCQPVVSTTSTTTTTSASNNNNNNNNNNGVSLEIQDFEQLGVSSGALGQELQELMQQNNHNSNEATTLGDFMQEDDLSYDNNHNNTSDTSDTLNYTIPNINRRRFLESLLSDAAANSRNSENNNTNHHNDNDNNDTTSTPPNSTTTASQPPPLPPPPSSSKSWMHTQIEQLALALLDHDDFSIPPGLEHSPVLQLHPVVALVLSMTQDCPIDTQLHHLDDYPWPRDIPVQHGTKFPNVTFQVQLDVTYVLIHDHVYRTSVADTPVPIMEPLPTSDVEKETLHQWPTAVVSYSTGVELILQQQRDPGALVFLDEYNVPQNGAANDPEDANNNSNNNQQPPPPPRKPPNLWTDLWEDPNIMFLLFLTLWLIGLLAMMVCRMMRTRRVQMAYGGGGYNNTNNNTNNNTTGGGIFHGHEARGKNGRRVLAPEELLTFLQEPYVIHVHRPKPAKRKTTMSSSSSQDDEQEPLLSPPRTAALSPAKSMSLGEDEEVQDEPIMGEEDDDDANLTRDTQTDDDQEDLAVVTPLAYLHDMNQEDDDDEEEEDHCAICLDELGYHPCHAEQLAQEEWEAHQAEWKAQEKEKKRQQQQAAAAAAQGETLPVEDEVAHGSEEEETMEHGNEQKPPAGDIGEESKQVVDEPTTESENIAPNEETPTLTADNNDAPTLSCCKPAVPQQRPPPDILLVTLPCKHSFHLQCIVPWMQERQAICPLCNFNVYKDFRRRQRRKRRRQRQLEQQQQEADGELGAETNNDVTASNFDASETEAQPEGDVVVPAVQPVVPLEDPLEQAADSGASGEESDSSDEEEEENNGVEDSADIDSNINYTTNNNNGGVLTFDLENPPPQIGIAVPNRETEDSEQHPGTSGGRFSRWLGRNRHRQNAGGETSQQEESPRTDETDPPV